MATSKKALKHYDKHYLKERNSAMPHVRNVLFNLLKEHKVKKILEVAPGAGDLMKELKRKGYQVKGIDISPDAAKLSGSIVGSATDLPFKKESFDCVIGLSIIEHLDGKDGRKFAKESYRVLKKKGIFFVLTPNYSSPLRYLQGDKWYGYSDPTHIFFYTPTTLKKLLSSEKFSHVSSQFKTDATTMDWPLPAFFKKSPPFLKRILNTLLISTPLADIRDSLWVVGVK